MEIAVDVTSPVYPYRQIADQLRAAIQRGDEGYTDRLPSLTELMDMITPRPGYNTCRKAIEVLKNEGLVMTAPGRGTFVRRSPS